MEPAHEIETKGDVEATATAVDQKQPADKAAVQARIDAVGAELRKIILDAKKLPRDKSLDIHTNEMRCLAEAQNALQTGFLWLRRAVNPTKDF